MTFTAEEIDRLVSEVLRRLSLPPKSGAQAVVAAAPVAKEAEVRTEKQLKNRAASSNGSTGRLQLDLPLITLEQIESKLTDVGSVVIPLGAVVTPAVKDLLRERNISLERASKGRNVAENHNSRHLLIGTAEIHFEAEPLMAELSRRGVACEPIVQSALASLVEEMSERVASRGALGLLFTKDVPAAACLANRCAGVRAAEARCTRSAREAVTSIGANLLVINPLGMSTYELQRVAGVLLAGEGKCPAAWRSRMG